MLPGDALAHWACASPIRPPPDEGLINKTWSVGDPATHILQWVNPIFGPDVHSDIDAVTQRLENSGLPTPRLIRTRGGELCLPDGEACWRLMTFVPGRTLHFIHSPAEAAAAGHLVGRFHAALADWTYRYRFHRPGFHDTRQKMAALRTALGTPTHPLLGPATRLGESILAAWERWDGTLDLPLRHCHGDLKVSNIRFAAQSPEGVCLIDLDTLGAIPLPVEMGDAWRSWCNPAPEDEPQTAHFDVEIFEASTTAWLDSGPQLTPDERDNMVPAIERICLELAARFCADAIENTYFREDRDRFSQPGSHNLLRAESQFHLARSARANRLPCEAVLRRAG